MRVSKMARALRRWSAQLLVAVTGQQALISDEAIYQMEWARSHGRSVKPPPRPPGWG